MWLLSISQPKPDGARNTWRSQGLRSQLKVATPGGPGTGHGAWRGVLGGSAAAARTGGPCGPCGAASSYSGVGSESSDPATETPGASVQGTMCIRCALLRIDTGLGLRHSVTVMIQVLMNAARWGGSAAAAAAASYSYSALAFA